MSYLKHKTLVLRLRGMISSFTHDDDNQLDQYLLLPDDQFETAPIPLAELHSKVTETKARTTPDTLEYMEDNGVLTAYHLNVLNDFVTYFRNTIEKFEERPDIRIIIPDRLLSLLFDDDLPASFIRSLVALHESDLQSMFVLRTTRGPTRKCINFHVDGKEACKTVQIPLNDPAQYKGGKLVFFIDDKIVVPPRTLGSLTRHRRAVLHGVTAVQQGVRNSFFIVDKPYGSGLEEQEGVITLKESLVVDYNSRSETIALKHSLVKEKMHQLQKDNTKLQGENEQLVVENTELKSQVSRLQLENEEMNASLCKLMGSTVDSLNMIALQGLKEQLYTTLASVAKREIVIREEEKREKECALCMENPRNIMLKPCNHVCMCEECAKKVVKKRCPICNQVYRSAEKLYI